MKDLFKLIVGVLAALQVESKVGSRNLDPTATDQRSSPAGTNDCNYSQKAITLEACYEGFCRRYRGSSRGQFWFPACGLYRQKSSARAVQRRLDINPQAMWQRPETVEHPFGTLTMRMGPPTSWWNGCPRSPSKWRAARTRLQSHPRENIMGIQLLMAAMTA